MGESGAMDRGTLCAMISRGGNEEKREERKGSVVWVVLLETDPVATLAEFFDVRAKNSQVKYILNKMTAQSPEEGGASFATESQGERE